MSAAEQQNANHTNMNTDANDVALSKPKAKASATASTVPAGKQVTQTKTKKKRMTAVAVQPSMSTSTSTSTNTRSRWTLVEKKSKKPQHAKRTETTAFSQPPAATTTITTTLDTLVATRPWRQEAYLEDTEFKLTYSTRPTLPVSDLVANTTYDMVFGVDKRRVSLVVSRNGPDSLLVHVSHIPAARPWTLSLSSILSSRTQVSFYP
jgi:hypothetical protein